jgi:exopolysaccharide production protein ExoY
VATLIHRTLTSEKPAEYSYLRGTQGSTRGDGYALRAFALAERGLAAALLVLSAPILTVSSAIIFALSRRSPFVAHRRVGKDGRPLWVVKLRTMWNEMGPSKSGFLELLPVNGNNRNQRKSPNDPRITSRFAAACRRYSIDELPQLWNVMRGEMALVGPRPLTWEEIQLHYPHDSEELLSRKPGLSGLWQITGRSRLTYQQRRRLDLLLIRRWSLGLYLRILIETVPTVLSGKDAC